MKRKTKSQKFTDCLLKIFFSVASVVFVFWLSLGSEFTLSYNKERAVEKFDGLKRIQSAIKVVKNVSEVFE